MSHTLQDTTDNILTLLSTLDKLGQDLFEKHVNELEYFFSQTAFSSEAEVNRKTAIAALETFDNDIQEQFPIIAEQLAKGSYDLELDFFKMQPSYKPAVRRLTELKRHVLDHVSIHLSAVERKYKQTMDDTKKKVKSAHFTCRIFVKKNCIFIFILIFEVGVD
jgi:hypothetical protein